MSKKIIFYIVTLFGIGKISKIPGSVASLVTTMFLFFLFHIFKVSPNIFLISLIIIFFISLYAVNIFIKDLMENRLLTIRAAENTVRILPPLNVKKSELDQAIKIINKVCLKYK